MKDASASYKAILSAGPRVFIPAELYAIALPDGTNLYYTTFDHDVLYAGNRYSSQPPGTIERGDITQKRGVETSAMNFKVAYDNTGVDAGLNFGQSITGLRWRGAIVTMYRALWSPAGSGLPYPLAYNPDYSITAPEAVTFFLGCATQPVVDRGIANVVLATPNEKFNQRMPWRQWSPQCRATLFDTLCGLNKANYAVNGTVSAGSTPLLILTNGLLINAASPVLPGTAPKSGYFDTGVLRWTSGANVGLSSTIATYQGAGLANSYDSLVLADAPVAYYKLDGVSDTSSVLVDYSGNAYNGTNHGISFAGSGGPLAGGSGFASFNGSTKWGDLSAILNPRAQSGYLGGVSFECFINVAVTGQPNGLFNSGTTGSGSSEFPGSLQCSSNNVNFAAPLWRWGTFHPASAFTVPALNQWVHMVAIFRGARYVDVYLNGYQAVTTEDVGVDNFIWSHPTLGKAIPVAGTTIWYAGSLGRFAIYPYAMDSTQILTHYIASLTNPVSQTFQQLQLVLHAPNAPQAGDTFTVWPGCDKSLRTCVQQFGNVGSTYPGNAFLRFAGTPDVPPLDSSG